MPKSRTHEVWLTVELPPHKVSVILTNMMAEDKDGEWDSERYEATVSPNNPTTKIEQTVVHELIHALAEVFTIPCLQDEDAVRSLEYPLYTFLKFNTEFFGSKKKVKRK